ncbi:MAG: N-6 DNA methylase [Planctomycetota bacterium]
MANLTSFRIEGGLFPSDFAERLTSKSSGLDGLSPADYGKQDAADRDEAIQIAFRQTLSAWRRFQTALQQAPQTETHTSLTRERFLLPLFEALGYGRLTVAKAQKLGDRSYAISHQWMHVPIHLLGIAVDLDRRERGIRGAAQASPHGLVQEYLNASDEVLWALLSNGHTLRLLRDHKSLTRNAYVEFDLDRICNDEDYPGFALLWLLCHSSRAAAEKPEALWWETWYEQARQDGVRALDRLREGVKVAIEALGSGFLEHPGNQALRDALRDGSLTTDGYYRLLLRLVYRLLFLFVAEDRGVLLQTRDEFEDARRRFAEHYGTSRLRNLAAAIRGTQHGDLWQALRMVMDKLGDGGCAPLALPDLGPGFWGKEQLGLLAGAELRNVHLLAAVRALAFTEEKGGLHPVRYRDLGATEFGSVYESLLELKPQQVRAEVFSLAQAAGNERKTTGAYYTPDSLVQCLLDSALEPLLLRCREARDPAAALLDLKVCDPACGSGHFLVAAAHRIAKALAQVRSGDDEPSPVARREAMRDVVARCLYGVDLSEMAVELCKLNLWLEAQAPDLPLAFLDAHIQPGNSLLGATPDLIAKGIPDEAMDPLQGDDQEFCRTLRQENLARRIGGATLFDVEGQRGFAWAGRTLAMDYQAVETVADRSASDVREKAAAYGHWAASEARRREELIADAWCAAFVMKKSKDAPPPVTEEMFVRLRDGVAELPKLTRDEVKRLGRQFRFCHWWLKFPGVFGEGGKRRGFDLVIGNPPWERIKIAEKEWFAERSPEVANARNASERRKKIAELARTNPRLHAEFKLDLRRAEGESKFVRRSGRYPLCGRGDVNTYTLFAELAREVIAGHGRVGLIVPSGIATDATTQFFFQDLVDRESLQSLIDFENREGLFPAVDSRTKFCALTLRGEQERGEGEFAFFLRDPSELRDESRRFRLAKEDFALLNPNTKTCPIFRSRRDAELTKRIYRRVPILWDERRKDGNPWELSLSTMFHMSNDSQLFRTRQQCEAAGFELNGNRFVKGKQVMLPLYEAKMVHHFDHRFGDYRDLPEGSNSTQLPDVPIERLQDPNYEPLPRYWVPAEEVADRLRKADRAGNVEWSWPHDWLLGWRDICRSTDERTVIASVIPRVGVGNQLPLMLLSEDSLPFVAVLIGALSSFACDYAARQKVGGTHLNFFIFEQLPVLSPTQAKQPTPWSPKETVAEWMTPRVVELVATSTSLCGISKQLLGSARVFPFDPARRFQLRCELDAAFFHLYGLSRDEVAYVMDTFPIVRRHDEAEHGDYRTKLTILNLYDQMAR